MSNKMSNKATDIACDILQEIVERVESEELTLGETLLTLCQIKHQVASVMEMMQISSNKRLMESPS